jgi:hypothetical protein
MREHHDRSSTRMSKLGRYQSSTKQVFYHFTIRILGTAYQRRYFIARISDILVKFKKEIVEEVSDKYRKSIVVISAALSILEYPSRGDRGWASWWASWLRTCNR